MQYFWVRKGMQFLEQEEISKRIMKIPSQKIGPILFSATYIFKEVEYTSSKTARGF